MAKQILTDLDFNSVSKITNLPAPASASEPATKGYVDSAIEGLAWKDNARVATQSNINLASPGASVDGVTMATNDRVLVRAQTSAPENGLYIYNGASTPMTRAADANTAGELKQAVVTIDEGTSAGASFRQTSVNFTLDTNDVLWVDFGSATAAATETTAGKAEIATQSETDTGTDDARFITPLKLKTWSLRTRKHAVDIGDGSATSYTVTHNFNTRDVQVFVRRNSGNYDEVDVEKRVNNVNSVDILFAAAPASNAFRVIVLG